MFGFNSPFSHLHSRSVSRKLSLHSGQHAVGAVSDGQLKRRCIFAHGDDLTLADATCLFLQFARLAVADGGVTQS